MLGASFPVGEGGTGMQYFEMLHEHLACDTMTKSRQVLLTSWGDVCGPAFQSLMENRSDDSGNCCYHRGNPSDGDPTVHHCRALLL